MPEHPELTAAEPVARLPFVAPRSVADRAEQAFVGLAGLLLASVIAAADGGSFSDSWAWLALVSQCVATLRLILVPALPLRRLDWALTGAAPMHPGSGSRGLHVWNAPVLGNDA